MRGAGSARLFQPDAECASRLVKFDHGGVRTDALLRRDVHRALILKVHPPEDLRVCGLEGRQQRFEAAADLALCLALDIWEDLMRGFPSQRLTLALRKPRRRQ